MNARAGRPRRRLLLVWLLLAALTGIILVIDYRSRDDRADQVSASAPRMLMPAPIEEIWAIEVGHAGTLHRFERDTAGIWFYHGVHTDTQAAHAHQTDPAAAQIIEKSLAGLGRARMERQFELDVRAGTYGMNSPAMIVLVYGKGPQQPLAQYAVGDIAPDGLSRYVLPVGRSYVVTIANYQIDNLLSLIQAVAEKPGGGTSK